ncbi:putative xanthine dehydrogenase subunit D [Phycisphaerae bacterium RAS1]|nr:putative xanthine dehydrogenase subunit D [Phycisphaerae bacterium RAS1]
MSTVADAGAVSVSLTLNGRPVSAAVRPDESLLEMLRERFDLISPKNGCEPMGSCGCCVVLIDGKPRLSCTMKATAFAGKSIETLEGLPEDTRKQIADSFVAAGAVQCGFCIPGIAIRAHTMCSGGAAPPRDQIEHELRAHLCRCTGYKKIVDAVELLADVRNGGALPTDGCLGRVGERLNRYTGHEHALGDKRFIDDVKIDGMLFAAPRLSDHPRALVKRIDPAAALAIPGVVRVVTAADVPGDRYVGLITPDWPVFIAVGEETRYVGDVLAMVVASDMATARRAAAAIQIDYELRTPVTTTDEALRPDAPKIHPKGNLLSRAALKRGDSDIAFAAAAHVIEHTWQTQCIEHLFLEPEACIAIPKGTGNREQGTGNGEQDCRVGRAHPTCSTQHAALHFLTQGQGIFDDRRQVAKVLGWPIEKLSAELVSSGGAFGGKEDLSIQAQTALCAVLVDRPVKCVLTREESIRLHPKRHPVRISLKVGCDADGRLTAVRARIVGDKGAYASVGAKVLERSAGHAIGPYKCENIDIEALAVYTNNPPNGAMRGFGVNQTAFAIEGALDMLAERVGIDGWEMRWRNILRQGDRFCTGQRLTKPFGLEKTLLAVRDAYRGAKFAGIACGIKNVGIGNGLPEIGRVSLTVEDDGHVMLRTGHTEMGQGLFTVAIQAAVEETGLPAAVFRATCDTSDALDSGQTTGSRGTVLTCHAVIDACRKFSSEFRVASSELKSGRVGTAGPTNSLLATLNSLLPLRGRKYLGEWICYPTDKFGADVPDPKTHLTYGFATQVCILNDDGSVKKIVAAHDVGRAINPTLLEGQLEGSIHMGLGYALTEEFIREGGRIVTDDIKSCGVLRAHQMPEIELILIEEPDPECPFGARGIAEIGLVPTAPAVAGAIYKFDGVRRFTLPMKDSPAAKAMGHRYR